MVGGPLSLGALFYSQGYCFYLHGFEPPTRMDSDLFADNFYLPYGLIDELVPSISTFEYVSSPVIIHVFYAPCVQLDIPNCAFNLDELPTLSVTPRYHLLPRKTPLSASSHFTYVGIYSKLPSSSYGRLRGRSFSLAQVRLHASLDVQSRRQITIKWILRAKNLVAICPNDIYVL